jgi:hypothetical protein
MPYVVLLFFGHKEGTTPAAFRSYFETQHLPLIKSMAVSSFPTTHTRLYIHRSECDSNSSSPSSESSEFGEKVFDFPASVLMGKQEDFDYDAIAQLEFDDAAVFHAFIGQRKDPYILRRLEEDDEKFSDPRKTRAVVLGEVCVTRRDE